MKRKYIVFYIVLAALLIGILIYGTAHGAMKISAGDTVRVILSRLTGREELEAGVKSSAAAVIWKIRVPRILCGMFTGCGLAAAGVIFQGILQNPLADPYTLGISSGASFGAALAIYIGIITGTYLPPAPFALAAALITLAAVTAVSRRSGGFESADLIIAGIIVSAVMSSGVSMLKVLSGENVGAIVYWIMGSLAASGWKDVYILAPVVISGTAIAVMLSRRLDIMSLGDDCAASLGVNPSRTRLLYLIAGSLITAVCVSVSGVIGFVGLIVPHLLRFKLSSKNSVLLPASALCGAALLSLADNVTRLMPFGELPVGIITTIIGGPFFIYIFIRRRGV